MRVWGPGAATAVLAIVAALSSCVVPTAISVATPDDVLTTQRQQAIVRAFAAAIVHDDHAEIAEYATPDIAWTIPGSSVVSGRANGVAEVTRLADTFAQYELHISPQGLAFGTDTVAVKLHDNGVHNGKKLDQDVVNVLTIRGDKISEVTAHLTDVDSFDSYFS
jgi:uncharacterized protein